MKDDRDPELLGRAMLSLPGDGPLSVRSEGLDMGVPSYGSDEADGARMSFNGKMPKQPRGRPPEPTHALDAPPDLVDADVVVDMALEHGVVMDREKVREALELPVLDPCPSCAEQRTRVGRWSYCLNENCDRYEEPI